MNIETLFNSIAEATAESLRNWDIQKTIDEVRKSPEIVRLNEEIKNGRAFLNYFESLGG